MEYVLVAPNGRGSTTAFKECLPSKEQLEQMYADGVRLYVDGKKQTKAQMLGITENKGGDSK